jgi:hypothetical protein
MVLLMVLVRPTITMKVLFPLLLVLAPSEFGRRRPPMRWLLASVGLALVTIPLMLLSPSTATAWSPREVACGQLGVKCVCASSLGSSGTWVSGVGGDPGAWRATDQPTTAQDPKLCGTTNYQNSGQTVTISQGGAAPTNVPGPNGTTFVQDNQQAPAGITSSSTFAVKLDPHAFSPGGGFQSQMIGPRVGMRYYFQLSADYVGAYETIPSTGQLSDCTNDKFLTFMDYWSNGDGDNLWQWHADGGGGCAGGCVQAQTLRGKLIRLELYINGAVGTWPFPGGPNGRANFTSAEFRWKNITDNGPDRVVTIAGPASPGAVSAGEPNLITSTVQNFTWPIEHFRSVVCVTDPGIGVRCNLPTSSPFYGKCPGTAKFGYLLVAANLAAGERIPPAVEVEGGAGSPPPPPTSAPAAPGAVILK